MGRTPRVTVVGTGTVPPDDADVVVAHPAAAHSLARTLALRPGARRARLVIDGRLDPDELPGKVAIVEGAHPVGGLAIQRALQLGAEIVVVPRAVPGSCVQGGAAWYHGWKPHQLDEWAGGLFAGRTLAALTAPASAELQKDGSFTVSPADRARVVAELLVGTPSDGHSSPEVEARFEHLWILGAGPNRVRVWGAVGVPNESASTPDARVRLGDDVHDVPKPGRPPGHRLLDESALGAEITVGFQLAETGKRQRVPLRRLVHAAAREHGARAVLAVWTRDPTHWDWLDDLASEERLGPWLPRDCRFARVALPNLCAIRILLPAPADGLVERVLAHEVEVDAALLTHRSSE